MSRILLPEQHLFLAVLAFFFLVSLLQLRVTWVEKLSAVELPAEGFASLAKTGQPIGTKLSQRAMLAYTAADIAALHRAMQEDAQQVRQQLTVGMEGVAREVGQLRQANSRAAGDAAQVLREGQEGLQQLQAEIRLLKARVRRQGEEIAQQMATLTRLQAQHNSSEASAAAAAAIALARAAGEGDSTSSSTEGRYKEAYNAVAPWYHRPWRKSGFTQWKITDDRPQYWRQRVFEKYGAYGFVKFSAYRINAQRIAIIGLVPVSMGNNTRLTMCMWHGADGTRIDGDLSMHLVGKHHNYIYDVAVVLCTLSSATKAAGGHLEVRIEQEILYPYREEANQALEPPSPYPMNVAACVSPIHGEVDSRRLLEWLHFHRVLLPVDRFLLYDAGGIAGNGAVGASHKELQRVLAPRVKRGMVHVTWGFREVLQWDLWNHGEHLAIQDCIYRTHNTARWLLVSDIEEYLQIPPPLSLPTLLQEHESRPWLTFGVTVFNGSFCSPLQLPPQAGGEGEGGGEGGEGGEGNGGGEEGEEERKRAAAMAANLAKAAWAVERMRFRWPHPVCSATDVYSPSQCLDEEGSRRYILDPRQAVTATANSVASSRPGINLPVETARLAHFPGITQSGFAMCTLGEPTDTWWEREEGVAALGEAARRCPALKPWMKGPAAERCMPEGIAKRLGSRQ
ncbi:hypothetical protein CLOM_g20059 [Closterium sp. NIES-68]|nr:hypothetical protein CLOM_g20059 [Closterium sp. NIES-68]GJP73935.1 hypothetical protein CLOP_g4600 [Closterium sp. NIES-67]